MADDRQDGGERYEIDGRTYRVHPVAALFPLIEGRDYDDLVGDVRARGVQVPVTVSGDQIVDGRNRVRAALDAEVEVPLRELSAGETAVAVATSYNLMRRQLSPSQRTVIASELMRLRVPQGGSPPFDRNGGGAAPASDGSDSTDGGLSLPFGAPPDPPVSPDASSGGPARRASGVRARAGSGSRSSRADPAPDVGPSSRPQPDGAALDGGLPVDRLVGSGSGPDSVSGAASPAADGDGPAEPAADSAAPFDTVAGADGAGDDAEPGGEPLVRRQSEAAEMMGVSPEYLREFERVREQAPDLVDPVKDGLLTVRDAYAIRQEDLEVRRRAVEKCRAARDAGRTLSAVNAVKLLAGKPPRSKSKSKAAVSDDADLPPLPSVTHVPGAGSLGGGQAAAPAAVPAAGAAVGGAVDGGAAPVPRAGVADSALRNGELFVPALVLAGTRIVLGEIDLDPCSSEAAQERVAAAEWYGRSQDGLSNPWRGTVWVFPPFGAVDAFASHFDQELRAGRVRQAGFMGPASFGEPWAQKLLGLPQLTAVVVSRKPTSFPSSDGSDVRSDYGMAVFFFGVDLSAVRRSYAPWGAVLAPAAAG